MKHGWITTQLHHSHLRRQQTKNLMGIFRTAMMAQLNSPSASQKQATSPHPSIREGACTNQKRDGSNHQATLHREEVEMRAFAALASEYS
jgi:hypothetical protein